MTLVRWDPFRDLMTLQQRQLPRYGEWVPAVDIFEKGDDLVIRAEIPGGVEKDDLDIRIEDNTLVISGERKRDAEFEERDAYRLERSFGLFSRSFTLPTTVDSARISASFKNGVLELTLPKAEQAKPHKIEILAA